MSSTTNALEAAVTAMTTGSKVFDVTIICTTDDYQAEYWMSQLGAKTNNGGTSAPIVLAVSEDWNSGGGAGNGLGTLYAFEKACKLAKERFQTDLLTQLTSNQVSVSLYHTAGKGTRMAPLPASENNNKPGVKLPVLKSGTTDCWTVLESVICQTGVYARKGRLSVFWGDQVFIPSASLEIESNHHVDILCTLLGDTAPTAEEWTKEGLEKYGVIAVLAGEKKEAAQLEKVSHKTAVNMLQTLGQIGRVGPSLGSFSVSAAFLAALCDEFRKELDAKTDKLDTDPHFWMPLTLPRESYIKLMKQKETAEDVSGAHWDRMNAFKTTKLDLDKMGLFTAVDVGAQACWWDFGQLKLYSQNTRRVLEDSPDAQLLRSFFSIDQRQASNTISDAVTVDDKSCVFGCKVDAAGKIVNSVMAGVTTKELVAEDAVIVNCVAPKIQAGKGAILYNIISDTEVIAGDGEVWVEVTDEKGESFVLKSRMDICGGKAWKQKLDMNELSFEDVHKKNKQANICLIDEKRREKYSKVAASL